MPTAEPWLHITNKIRRVRPHLLAIEDVKRAQPLEKLAAEPFERQMDDLAAEPPRQPPPARRRNPGAHDRDVPVLAVQERRGQQPFFERFGEIEPLVDPDVGDRPRRKDEEAPPYWAWAIPGPTRFFMGSVA